MTSPQSSAATKVWEQIDRDKRLDRLIKRVSVVAWSATGVLVLILLIAEAAAVSQFIGAALGGAVPWATVFGIALPGIITLGALCVFVATLATIAMFFRLRTASLAEIQLRLAALEESILARDTTAR
jgi:hypothetical protein